MTHIIFCYGTLKRGYSNHKWILAEAKFLGAAVSKDRYAMLSRGVPFLVDDDDGHLVLGELYEVDDRQLARCDSLEGHPHHYRRYERTFLNGKGREVTAWVYLWQHWYGDSEDRMQPDGDGLIEWHREPYDRYREDDIEDEADREDDLVDEAEDD